MEPSLAGQRVASQRAGPSARNEPHGSRTMTMSRNRGNGEDSVGVLRLRGTDAPQEQPPREPNRRVVWTDDTVDNEGMGKKKSKSEF